MTPPPIIFRTTPSVLVLFDGDPIIEEIPEPSSIVLAVLGLGAVSFLLVLRRRRMRK